jgi:hypothetical protein
LALALGMTVSELLARMSAAELIEWQMFDAVEPIGEPRADLRAGILASLLWNANFKGIKTPFEFMPYAAGPVMPRKTPEQIAHDKMEDDMKAFFRARAG